MMGDTHRESMLEIELERLQEEYAELARDFALVCGERNELRGKLKRMEMEKLMGEDDGR